jgi:hypothetical protein
MATMVSASVPMPASSVVRGIALLIHGGGGHKFQKEKRLIAPRERGDVGRGLGELEFIRRGGGWNRVVSTPRPAGNGRLCSAFRRLRGARRPHLQPASHPQQELELPRIMARGVGRYLSRLPAGPSKKGRNGRALQRTIATDRRSNARSFIVSGSTTPS